jgi:hypothetical protein
MTLQVFRSIVMEQGDVPLLLATGPAVQAEVTVGVHRGVGVEQ